MSTFSLREVVEMFCCIAVSRLASLSLRVSHKEPHDAEVYKSATASRVHVTLHPQKLYKFPE